MPKVHKILLAVLRRSFENGFLLKRKHYQNIENRYLRWGAEHLI